MTTTSTSFKPDLVPIRGDAPTATAAAPPTTTTTTSLTTSLIATADQSSFSASLSTCPAKLIPRPEEVKEEESSAGVVGVSIVLDSHIARDTVKKQTKEEEEPLQSVPSLSTTSPNLTRPKPPSISITTDIISPNISSYIPLSRTSSPQASLTKTTSNKSSGSPSLASMPVSIMKTSNMFFSSAHRRRNLANTNALTNYEADLNNKDRAKQKEAVRRFLDDHVEEDWRFEWSPEQHTISDSNGRKKKRRSIRKHQFVDELAATGRKAERWKERDEWLSNTNDSDDDPAMPTAASPDTATPTSEKGGTFKFENPDDVGEVVRKRELDRKIRRERKLQEELTSNEGLRCFVARRDAWTGARKVKRDTTTTTTTTRTSSKTLTNDSQTHSHPPHSTDTSPDAPQPIDQDGYKNDPSSNSHSDSDPDSSSDDNDDEATEIPIAPPLLPPTNPMRASISPAAYPTIYDKVILQNQTPSCPVNLQDILNACVQGWKRDGEWPPKNGVPEASLRSSVQRKKGKGRKLSVAGILGLGLGRVDSKDGGGGGGKDGAAAAAGGGGGNTGGEQGVNGGSVNGSSESGLRKGFNKIFGGKKDGG